MSWWRKGRHRIREEPDERFCVLDGDGQIVVPPMRISASTANAIAEDLDLTLAPEGLPAELDALQTKCTQTGWQFELDNVIQQGNRYRARVYFELETRAQRPKKKPAKKPAKKAKKK